MRLDSSNNGGSGTIKKSLEAITYGGHFAVIGFLSSAPRDKMPDVAGLALAKGATVCGIMVGSKHMLEDVIRFIGAHNLPIPVEKTFKFTRDKGVRLERGQKVGGYRKGGLAGEASLRPRNQGVRQQQLV
ncbi:hypothetical protein BO86DRAFT_432604 [Aspergillus japonicus CBS 114.51]|uniref:Alcohol dehydrogenase-like C-terminal domain-containing protein n=1 Tax=Aspergillus japonicus CBS 114.51 TaxID=1448312 RepID=A0A8T8WZY9_ASPJA|nr:hypothetical protein BO86DRAFT_432604 [Aspergillus japonicus CBS 114.51]RAH80869.1 hypothetical protein BO86DRAFT_432604 [Aspergillus japonicus CBS 114.51]